MVVPLGFGAGPVADAFFGAFRIPNILRRLLAEGALSTAMIPVFSEYLVTRSRHEVLRMLRAVLALALVALGVTVLLGIATAPWIVKVIAPGIADDPARGGLTVLLTRVMFPYVVLVGLAALAAGALNAQGRFFASALGPAVQNVGMIVAISLRSEEHTSELQSQSNLVCRLLLEKKKKNKIDMERQRWSSPSC